MTTVQLKAVTDVWHHACLPAKECVAPLVILSAYQGALVLATVVAKVLLCQQYAVDAQLVVHQCVLVVLVLVRAHVRTQHHIHQMTAALVRVLAALTVQVHASERQLQIV